MRKGGVRGRKAMDGCCRCLVVVIFEFERRDFGSPARPTDEWMVDRKKEGGSAEKAHGWRTLHMSPTWP